MLGRDAGAALVGDQAAVIGVDGVNRPGFTGGSAVPLVLWSRMAGFSCHGGVFSNCIGVSMPSALWRLVRLWKISRYSKIALASSTRVFQRCRSSSSTCIRDQNASTMALS
jgi:hypothetical protein